MANPVKFTWAAPTANADGTPIAAGEITGYQIGIRKSTDPVPAQAGGVYPTLMPAEPSSVFSEALALLTPPLASGSYFAAIQATTANGPSLWSTEISFSWVSLPLPPGSFAVV